MRTRFANSIAAILLAVNPVVLAQSDPVLIGKAEAVLKNLQGGRYADVAKEFDPTMTNALPEEKLRSVWEAMTAQFGAVRSIDERRSGELKGFRVVELIVTLGETQMVQRISFDSAGKISGLAYQPANLAVLPASK